MNESNALTPKQIAEKTSDNAVAKAGLSVLTMLLLGMTIKEAMFIFRGPTRLTP